MSTSVDDADPRGCDELAYENAGCYQLLGDAARRTMTFKMTELEGPNRMFPAHGNCCQSPLPKLGINYCRHPQVPAVLRDRLVAEIYSACPMSHPGRRFEMVQGKCSIVMHLFEREGS